MTDATIRTVEQQYRIVHLNCRDLPLEAPASAHPLFAVDDAPPLHVEAAQLSASPSVTIHRPAELAAQQRAPLGTRTIGKITICTQGHQTGGSSSSEGTTTTHTVPLYEACVAYRRPNAYKERPSLCIVDDSSSGRAARHHRHRGGPSAKEERKDAQRVCFVDLVSLTYVSRVLLRCTRTGELLVPTPLFCRYSTTTAGGTRDAAQKGKDPQMSRGANNAHAQHHRRRVVMLPATADGETYELVTIVLKRSREE